MRQAARGLSAGKDPVARLAEEFRRSRGPEFDGSPASIPALDRLLAAGVLEPDDVSAAAAYFGQVLRSQFGGQWVDGPNGLLLRISRLRVLVTEKVQQVLCSGPPDGLEAFFFILAKKLSVQAPSAGDAPPPA